MKEPRVNIGQSEFQDTFMVIANEATPFRKLRKLELQIKELEDALKLNDFQVRKTKVKLDRIQFSQDAFEVIEREELEYGLEGLGQLKEDAERRLANFKEIKRQLLEETPEEYWEQGFENAETEYWIEYFSRRAALEIMANGRISVATLGEITRFPDEIAAKIMQLTPHKQLKIAQTTEIAEEQARLINQQQKQAMIGRSSDK